LDGRRIIGDIEGTNARFAIAEGGKYRELMHVEVARLTHYLNGLPPQLQVPSGSRGSRETSRPVSP